MIQVVAQARQTAKRISDRSSQAAASKSFLSWLTAPSSDSNNGVYGLESDESTECLRKTHEFLDRALENLCTIFKVRPMVDCLAFLKAGEGRAEDSGQSCLLQAVFVLSSSTKTDYD